MVEQESVLRGIAQCRAGRQQCGAVGIVEIEAERNAGAKIVARECDVVEESRIGEARSDRASCRDNLITAASREI